MRKRILIVDDETDIRLVIRTLLSTAGYEVEDAQDGEAALQKLSSKHFDLMVLDIMMPRMDGHALMEQLLLGAENSLHSWDLCDIMFVWELRTLARCHKLLKKPCAQGP